jgi:hypothetical protein
MKLGIDSIDSFHKGILELSENILAKNIQTSIHFSHKPLPKYLKSSVNVLLN